MAESKGIKPILRSFMHVALLRRRAMAKSTSEEQKLVDEFLAINTDEEAKAFIARARAEARQEDLIAMHARAASRMRKRRG
jgi:hypothetical protein